MLSHVIHKVRLRGILHTFYWRNWDSKEVTYLGQFFIPDGLCWISNTSGREIWVSPGKMFTSVVPKQQGWWLVSDSAGAEEELPRRWSGVQWGYAEGPRCSQKEKVVGSESSGGHSWASVRPGNSDLRPWRSCRCWANVMFWLRDSDNFGGLK